MKGSKILISSIVGILILFSSIKLVYLASETDSRVYAAYSGSDIILVADSGSDVSYDTYSYYDSVWLTEDLVFKGHSSTDIYLEGLNLPSYGIYGSNITWTSSNESLVALNGSVTRPVYTQGNQQVTLTAAITYGGMESTTKTKVFQVTVTAADPANDAERDWGWLDETLVLNGNSGSDSVTDDVYMPVIGAYGSDISWTSGNTDVVAANGQVTTPSVAEGDQNVRLTATITKGSDQAVRTFDITVKVSDEDLVAADSIWLTDALVLNGNDALDNVASELNLPALGPNGTTISWAFTPESVVNWDGSVNRPAYDREDQTVILTATIRKGTEWVEKTFTITVKAKEITDTEAVSADYTWLTDALILNSDGVYNNDRSNVARGLKLPSLGANGSAIVWTSSDTGVIGLDGTVKQPSYTRGDQTVMLTAAISKGTTGSVRKTFVLTVKALDRTVEEAFAVDNAWLDVSRTLGKNLSQYSICENLSLPATAPAGSVITWTSSDPAITDSGIVTRPGYLDAHKSVTLTATLQNEGLQVTRVFDYTVLAIPDTFGPEVVNTSPASNSTAFYDTRQITITFNEDIKKQRKGTGYSSNPNYGIQLNGPNAPGFYIRIDNDKNQLIITLNNDMEYGKAYELVISKEAITDGYGNIPEEDFKLTFNVEEKLIKNIEVISSNPEDMAKEVPVNSKISFKYNYGEIIRGKAFNSLSVHPKGGSPIPYSNWYLVGDTVSVGFSTGGLQPGVVYEIYIPAGAVEDRFKNQSSAKIIRFRTESSDEVLKVTGVYPGNGDNGVNIHQNIEVYFSEAINPADCKLKLRDSSGNLVTTAISKLKAPQTGVVMLPFEPLKPNTDYTVTGPYDSAANPSDIEFKTSFKTGTNSLGVEKIYPTSIDEKKGAPINAPVKIEFSSPISRGPGFADIKISDPAGNVVPFNAVETDNKAALTPSLKLSPSAVYTVHIPEGAYKNESNDMNDALDFRFTTARQLDVDYTSFVIKPSSKWIKNKPLSFSAEWIEKAFNSSGYKITSYEWNFGDGTGSGKKIDHTFNVAKDFTVKLKVTDQYGISYEFDEKITIVDKTSSLVKMTVSPDYHHRLSIDGNNRNNDYKVYTVNLSCNGVFLPDETIRVSLYKNGVKQKDLTTVTTGRGDKRYTNEWGYSYTDNGTAFFNFWYELGGYLGTYELVFDYGSIGDGKTVRLPVTITESKPKETMRIKLYSKDTGKTVDYSHGLYFLLDGEEKFAERQWYNDEDGYCYIIRDVETWEWHTLQLEPKYAWIVHNSDTEDIYFTGVENLETLPVYGKQPGLDYIKSGFSDSRHGNPALFIDHIPMPPVTFEFFGDWDNLTPGYYELQTDTGRKIATTEESKIELNPGFEIRPGEKLLVRMVSKTGVKSSWVDAKVEVAPRPSIGFGPGWNINYVDGEYRIDAPLAIKEIIGGSADVLDGVPLLDNARSFGLGNDNYSLEGFMNKLGYIKLNFAGGLSYGKEVKKARMVSTGYDITADMYGNVFLVYNRNSHKWELRSGEFTLMGDGSYFWKKSYRVPKVNIGADATLRMGSVLGGTLFADRNEAKDEVDYSGIIYFEPYVRVSIEAGVKGCSVEGYVEGRVDSEIHIPTGYVQVEPNITAGIDAKFLYYTQEVYKKKIVDEHWDNGKEKVHAAALNDASQRFLAEFGKGNARLAPMSRNYLSKESRWPAGGLGMQKNTLLAAGEMSPLMMAEALSHAGYAAEETNPQIVTMPDNIFPDTDVRLVHNGNELWMVWADDNPDRSAMNRTQMRYSVYKNGVWSAPVWMGQDGTADFSPAAASTGNGVLMAWQNIRQTMADDAGPGAFIENSEISVTQSVYTTGSSDVQIVALTNDGQYDYSPQLAANGSKALLVWTKSRGFTLGSDLEDLESSESGDSLFYSGWDGSTWSPAAEIAGDLPAVMDSSLTMNEDEGLLLYTLDMDNDMSTQEDREVLYRIYENGTWGAEKHITGNQAKVSSPKAVFSDGEWFVTWQQDGSIMYCTINNDGERGDIKTDECLSNVQGNYEIAAGDGEKPQIALVYKQMGDNNVRTLSASFYDIEKGIWSNEIPLTEGDGFVRSFSPVFKDGKLNIAYTEADMVTEVIDGAEYPSASDNVHLRMLTYTPVHDLALDAEDGLQLSPEIPLPGARTTVSATIVNKGDFAENTTLYLYNGNPLEGGVKIGEAATAQPIPARSSAKMEIEWVVGPEERDKYDIYAVVKPEEGVTEIDESNNTVNRGILTADIEVTSLECENLANDDYQVTATVANRGSRLLQGIEVQLGQDKKILETREFEELEPGQEAGLSFIFSSRELGRDEDGRINMTLNAMLPEGIEDNSPDNNTYGFVPEPASIVVDGVSPAKDETQAGIQKPITLRFNMNIEEGDGFDQIVLQDDNLNTIDISKTLEGNTLTVTPKSALSYSTGYTLTIPVEALGDAYGHTMDSPYSLSFDTTASSPEVIFAYPGQEMGNAALDTDIKMQFNQTVLSGPTYGGIAIFGPDSKEISASVSLQGEWLYIRPTGRLNQNTTYSLVIPAGAVKNNKGEAQQEDYTLEFTTAVVIDNEDNEVQTPAYKISRQTSNDGSSTAIVDLDDQAVMKLKADNGSMVTLDLTDEVKEDGTIGINLSESAINQLAVNNLGLNIVTGKGDIKLPADLIKSFVKNGEKAVTITIAKNNEKLTAVDSVSGNITDFSIKAGEKQVTEFKPQVVVTIYLDISKVENAKKVIVCVYDEDTGSWRPVGGVADGAEGTVTFNAGHFSTYAAFETQKSFDDVTSDWAKEKVEVLASRHLINGITDKTFNPEGSITRAEFTALTARSLYKEFSKSKGTFADVADGSWYADAVETAYGLGLVSGTGMGKFEPAAKLSREQLATIACRLYRYKAGTEATGKISNTFTDGKDISAFAEEAVNFVANAGIMIGNGGRFEPKRSTTRQEAAVVLYRLLEYMGEL